MGQDNFNIFANFRNKAKIQVGGNRKPINWNASIAVHVSFD